MTYTVLAEDEAQVRLRRCVYSMETGIAGWTGGVGQILWIRNRTYEPWKIQSLSLNYPNALVILPAAYACA